MNDRNYRALALAVLLLFPTLLLASEFSSFSPATNKRIEDLLRKHSKDNGRKVAVFDFDGTLLGERPYYAGDEFFLADCDAGLLKTRFIPFVPGLSLDKTPAQIYYGLVKDNATMALGYRAQAYAGQNVQAVRDRALAFLDSFYARKIFEPSRQLVRTLQKSGFEVWVVTGSIEFIVDSFIEKHFGIPRTNVIGVRTLVTDGVVQPDIVQPVSIGRGKTAAIETYIKTQPLIVVGNSAGDTEMLGYAKEFAMVINPAKALREKAGANGWSVEEIVDPVFPDGPKRYLTYGLPVNE